MPTPLSDREGLPSLQIAQSKAHSAASSPELGDAAALACWMIFEKNFPLNHAKKTASKKYGVTQVSVDKLIRKIIPAWYFEDRMRVPSTKGAVASNPGVLKKSQKRLNQELDKQKSRHIVDL